MEFEINASPALSDKNMENTQEFHDFDNKVHTFRAHRVIVGSRCEWFNKALSSGMQESINR